MLESKQLNVYVTEENNTKKQLIKNVSFTIEKGKTVAIMGPNGAGKSTLAHTIMGNPQLETTGKILLNQKNILEMTPDERAKEGIFLSFQHPAELPGVSFRAFLRASMNARYGRIPPIEFNKQVKEALQELNMDEKFLERSVNEGLSGGEKKRAEILQLLLLKPKLAILDETDSGLDVDALKTVAQGVNKTKNNETIFLIITHYNKILHYIAPDQVIIMKEGSITQKGGKELIEQIEQKGFEK